MFACLCLYVVGRIHLLDLSVCLFVCPSVCRLSVFVLVSRFVYVRKARLKAGKLQSTFFFLLVAYGGFTMVWASQACAEIPQNPRFTAPAHARTPFPCRGLGGSLRRARPRGARRLDGAFEHPSLLTAGSYRGCSVKHPTRGLARRFWGLKVLRALADPPNFPCFAVSMS